MPCNRQSVRSASKGTTRAMRIISAGSVSVWTACVLALLSRNVSAQTFVGTNQPGTFQDFPLTVSAGATNLAISIGGSSTTFSDLLLKAGGAPSDTNFD